jgi:hypothetical protein
MASCKNPIAVYRGNVWECANCGSIACAKEEISPRKKSQWEEKKCECGANTLLGKDNKHHATFCDLYKKP